MASGVLTRFTTNATRTRIYQLRLIEPDGSPHRWSVIRNGQVVQYDGSYVFSWSPESITREWRARTTITQTPHGSWVDSYGEGLPMWTIRGTTGYSGRRDMSAIVGPNQSTDGYLAFHAFTDMVEAYLSVNRQRSAQAALTGTTPQLLRMEFHDFWDDDVWQIEPEGLPTKIRDRSHLLLIRYEWRFTGIRDLRKRAVPTTPDPIATALIGSKRRARAIGNAIESWESAVDADIQALRDFERENPGDAAIMLAHFSDTLAVVDGESSEAMIERTGLNGISGSTVHTIDNLTSQALQSSDGLSQSLNDALVAAREASNSVGLSALGGSRANAQSSVNSMLSALTSVTNATPVTQGDSLVLATLTPTWLTSLSSQANGMVSNLIAAPPGSTSVPSFSSVSDAISTVVDPLRGLGGTVIQTAEGVKDRVDIGLKTVRAGAEAMRRRVTELQYTINKLRILSNAAQHLRLLRRTLIQYQCAIQTLLAFPYLFQRDLQQSLQALLDLFNLSGCATTFPNLRPLTWRPNIPLPRVITA